MPEQIRCPSCYVALRVPEDLLGKNVQCPKCRKTFVAELEGGMYHAEGVVQEPTPSAHRPQPLDRDAEEEFPDEEDRDAARRRRRRRYYDMAERDVIGPAISIMVVSGFSILFGLLDLAYRILQIGLTAKVLAAMPTPFATGQAIGVFLGGCFDLLSIILSIIMIIGAVKMKNLQNHGTAITTCILAMVPLHCCCLLGLPFGIWGLVILNKQEVKDSFRNPYRFGARDGPD